MNLLLATPCNLVANDQELGPSLIGVFHDMTIKIHPDIEIPGNALIPKEWAIFSKWMLSSEETRRDYVLVSEVYWPDGTLLHQTKSKSSSPATTALIFIIKHQAFPFGQDGRVRIRLWMENEDKTLVHESIEIFISVRVQKNVVLG